MLFEVLARVSEHLENETQTIARAWSDLHLGSPVNALKTTDVQIVEWVRQNRTASPE